MKLPKYELINKKGKGYKRDWGHIHVDFEGNSKGSQLGIAELIRSMFIEYAECNARSCEKSPSNDFIMGWRERENQGLIYHSFYEAGGRKNIIISEFPYTLTEYFKMKNGDENEQRHNNRIDYHIQFIEKREVSRILLVEYKHSHVTVKYDNNIINFNNVDIRPWENALKKFVKPMDEKYIDEYLKHVWSNKRSTYQIVLLMVPVHHERKGGRKDKDFIYIDEECFKKELHKLQSRFNANLYGYWWLPCKRQKDPASWYEGKVETRKYYYGAFLFGSIKSCDIRKLL